jgi:dUTP pyrophosphatase
MKRTVKVLKHNNIADIVINNNGDCYDLFACEDVKVTPGRAFLVSLGISMKLPSGCIAKIYDRSSNPRKRRFKLSNCVGIIDNSYSGNEDVWGYQAETLKTGHGSYSTIHAGDRICQFEICLSQRATVWQKLLWLFTSGYKFKFVDSLEDANRGGFGSSDK